MKISPFKELFVWLLLAIGYYATAANAGVPAMAEFLEFMFADYIELWRQHFAYRVPSWKNPFVLLLAVLFFWRFGILGGVAIIRQICAIVAAIFLVRVVVYFLDLYPVTMSLTYAAIGGAAFLFYVGSTYVVDANMRGRVVAFIVRIQTD